MNVYSTIIVIAFLCVILTHSTSKFKGVHWVKNSNKWMVRFNAGKKIYYGGCFNDEMEAVKKVNQICNHLDITQMNPEFNGIPKQKESVKKKMSKYEGVYWNTQHGKWYAQIYVKNESKKFGGYFHDEHEAAKRVNQLCKELGITAKNPEITGMPNLQNQTKKNTSQYKGVSYDKKTTQWHVRIYSKGNQRQSGGRFNDELDAAKRVNQLCEELNIPLKNPALNAIPKQQYQKREKNISI